MAGKLLMGQKELRRVKVTVRELLEGRIKFLYQNTELEYVELEQLRHKEGLATRSA
ncbi:MAG: hypothetical protein SAMD01599839_12080 [Rectinema sp.]